jgi:hypothetical protein
VHSDVREPFTDGRTIIPREMSLERSQ